MRAERRPARSPATCSRCGLRRKHGTEKAELVDEEGWPFTGTWYRWVCRDRHRDACLQWAKPIPREGERSQDEALRMLT